MYELQSFIEKLFPDYESIRIKDELFAISSNAFVKFGISLGPLWGLLSILSVDVDFAD